MKFLAPVEQLCIKNPLIKLWCAKNNLLWYIHIFVNALFFLTENKKFFWDHPYLDKIEKITNYLKSHVFFICFQSILLPEFSCRISLRIFYFKIVCFGSYGLWELFVITQEKKLCCGYDMSQKSSWLPVLTFFIVYVTCACNARNALCM